MGDELLLQCGRLEALLQAQGVPALGFLQAGLLCARVRKRLRDAGLDPMDDVLSLFAWRNGTRTATGVALGKLWLIPGFYMMSLDDALTEAEARRGLWPAGWLPVFADGGGDFLLVNCSDVAVPTGLLVHFRAEEVEMPVEYLTLGDAVRTWARAFQDGVFALAHDGMPESDDDAFALLAAAENPRVSWWNE